MLKSYCEYKYYNEYDSSILLKDIQKNVDPTISCLNKEFLYIFYKIQNTEPCSYWNRDVYKETYSQLENLYKTNANQLMLSSIPWAIPFGDGEIQTMLNQANDVLEWYDNMQNPVPKWYTKGV